MPPLPTTNARSSSIRRIRTPTCNAGTSAPSADNGGGEERLRSGDRAADRQCTRLCGPRLTLMRLGELDSAIADPIAPLRWTRTSPTRSRTVATRGAGKASSSRDRGLQPRDRTARKREPSRRARRRLGGARISTARSRTSTVRWRSPRITSVRRSSSVTHSPPRPNWDPRP